MARNPEGFRRRLKIQSSEYPPIKRLSYAVNAAFSGRTPELEYRERRLMYFADALCLQGGFEASWLK